ncbi:MAG: efflux RND transporter permease subunit [Actinomycetota bacterium]
MLRRVVQFFAANTFITLPLWALLISFGLLSYLVLLPREGFPSVEVPVSIASGGYFVDDQERVDTEVLAPITEAVSARPEIESVSTNARDNSFVVIAQLDPDFSSAFGADLLAEEIGQLDLPPEAVWDVQALNAAQFLNSYDLLVGVLGPADATAEELEAAANDLLPAFDGWEEIAGAEVVELIDRGVDPATGQEVAREASFNQATTTVDDGIVIRPSVTIGVLAADNVDALAIRDTTDAALARAEAEGLVDDAFEPFVAVDFATQIRDQIGSLQGNVLTGVIAVALVALILISWRASIITALFILTVLATSVGVLYLFGISLNTISLFGLILALGLFVDDAIVITEAIDAFREKSSDPIEIIGNAIKRVGAAKISGTVTTLLVFAPMLAISGILGDFIRILPISVMVALTTSLVLALIFIPFAARFVVLSAPPSDSPLSRVGERVAGFVASFPGTRGGRGVLYALGGFALSLVLIGTGLFVLAPRVGFNIFPPQKDSTEIAVEYTFDPGTSIEDARELTREVNQAAADALGADLVSAYTYLGDSREALAQLSLTDLGANGRDAAPDLVENKLDPIAAEVQGARVVFNQLSAGPPEALFPFQMQIFGDDPEVLIAAGEQLAAELQGAEIERPNGTTFEVVETTLGLTDVVAREDGQRLIELRARFDADDVTTVTAQTQEWFEDRYGANELAALGLEADALGFDFGLESDNQESFNSLPVAFGIALLAMFVLLIIQFRSIIQWLLVFLAIPFSLFGVFGGLLLTDNVLSFFVMLGLLGLIGIAVNNTILLTDFANQERRAGADRKEAIEMAIRRRFRPLVATSLTTVAGVLPLALSDPFWESLGFTIIFGLLSSTFLVLLSFPAYYLAIEAIRDRIVTPWRPAAMRPGGTPDGAIESADEASDAAVEAGEQTGEGDPVTV